MSRVIEITTLQELYTYLANKKIVCCYFTATWCRPCKKFSPIYEETAKLYSMDTHFLKCDVNSGGEVAASACVRCIPYIMVWLNGRVIGNLETPNENWWSNILKMVKEGEAKQKRNKELFDLLTQALINYHYSKKSKAGYYTYDGYSFFLSSKYTITYIRIKYAT